MRFNICICISLQADDPDINMLPELVAQVLCLPTVPCFVKEPIRCVCPILLILISQPGPAA